MPFARIFKDQIFILCNSTGKPGMVKCRVYPVVSCAHNPMCVVCGVQRCPLLMPWGKCFLPVPELQPPHGEEGHLTWCASLISWYPMLLYAQLNLLQLELLDTEEQRQFTSCKPQNTDTHPWHIWRDLHYLGPLPLPTVSKVLKHAEQLSLKLAPYYALFSFFL